MLAPATDPAIQLMDRFTEEEFGILTPVGNAAIMAEAMQKMATNENLRKRLQEKSKKRASDFDISIIRKYFVKAFAG